MIICNIAEVLIILALGVLLARENQRRDRLQEGVERDLDQTAFSDLTDKQNVPSFLFCLKYVYPTNLLVLDQFQICLLALVGTENRASR